MLVQLLPDQISKFWGILKYSLYEAPPLTANLSYDDWANRILRQALSGQIEVWASYTKDDELVFEGIMLTTFLYDPLIDVRDLLIYYIYGYGDISQESKRAALRTIAKYAKSRDCRRITAYTNEPAVVSLVKRMGGDASITFITFNVEDLL